MSMTAGTFELCGEMFEIWHFPHLYRAVQSDRAGAEAQLRSIAAAWHEGNIGAAAVAWESDLAHG